MEGRRYPPYIMRIADKQPAILIMTTLHKVLDKSQARLYNKV